MFLIESVIRVFTSLINFENIFLCTERVDHSMMKFTYTVLNWYGWLINFASIYTLTQIILENYMDSKALKGKFWDWFAKFFIVFH